MADFIEGLGPAYFGHLLTRLADQFARGFEEWHRDVGLIAPARTYSTLRFLDANGPSSVTQLAEGLRQSHPLVIAWIRLLKELSLIEAKSDPADARRTVLNLTERGKAEVDRAKAYDVVSVRAFEQLFVECDANVFEPLWRIEKACRDRGFADRLKEHSGVG